MSPSALKRPPVFHFGRPFDQRRSVTRRKSAGLTLIELLVAITLSLLIMTALVALQANVSRTNNEMAKTNQLIENGRFALQLMQADVAHAGYWAGYQPTEATAVPDPCLAFASWPTVAADREAYVNNLMAVPVQGYASGASLSGCSSGLPAAVLANSSVLIVRHANTCVFGEANCAGGTDTGPHLQLSACRTAAPPEPSLIVSGTAADFVLLQKDCTTLAARRKFNVSVYYLATSAGLPSLMRMPFENGTFSPAQPLVEGIEAFQAEYGLDDLGSNGNPISATNPGDGNADTFVSCSPSCNLAQLDNVVAVKLHVLARNLERTAGYTDSKSYQVGPLALGPFNDSFKRHVFSTTVRLVNPSSRRETP